MMTPLEIVLAAQKHPLFIEDGEPLEITLLPGLSDLELARFAHELPCPLPKEFEELLRSCRGIEGVLGGLDLTGWEIGGQEFSEGMPHGVSIAADGTGNFWVIDFQPSSTHCGPIYYLAHDPPILLKQSETLSEFLTDVFKLYQPPFKSAVDDVLNDSLRNVWGTNPGVLSCEECLQSNDPDIRAFASTLDSTWQIIDLRRAATGHGLSWGRYGPATPLKRHGELALFAYQRIDQPAGLLSRLFSSFRR